MKIYNAGNRIVNTYIYAIDEGYVMVDTGYENGYKRFRKKIKKFNIALSDIKYLFLTHAHDDHAGFLNELLIQAPHLQVIVSSKSKPVLLRGQNSFEGGCAGVLAYIFCQIMKLLGKGEHRFPPIQEEFLERFTEVTNANQKELEEILQAKILYTPGHTTDSLSLMTKEGIIFCGDAAMNGIPSIHKMTIWIENIEDYEKSWNVLILQNSNSIYPAHGRPFNDKKLKNNILRLKNVTLYKLESI